MTLPPWTVIDYETFGIEGNTSAFPPIPVGVAIDWHGGATEYLAWAHPHGGNNCSFDEAKRAVAKAYQEGPVLFHNAKFDMCVASEHMGLPYPREWDDTLFMLFLDCPHAATFSLKPSSERVLGIPPDEQDVLRDWIVRNVGGATNKNFGAFIAQAPVSIVGPYAMGDTRRTRLLAEHLYPKIVANGMLEAYERERRLLPWLVEAERRGIRVDRKLLGTWISELMTSVEKCDVQVRRVLNAPGLNIDADADVAQAIMAAGLMPAPRRTKTGRVSTAKAALADTCTDPLLVNTLQYRNTAATLLRTFVAPWAAWSIRDGRLHSSWMQTRSNEGNGARSGRIGSMDPNLANVPNVMNVQPPDGLPLLPELRQAFLPEEGEVWVKADFSQQEFRLTGHYEDGAIQKAYQKNPDIDFHDFAQQLVWNMANVSLTRKAVKGVGFGLLYGAGTPKLAQLLGIPPDQAQIVKDAYFKALPGLLMLKRRVESRSSIMGGIRTLGGRFMPVEPPGLVDGEMRTFEYKQLNKLIQGSAADWTKQSIIDFCDQGTGARFMVSVYDEINISVPDDSVGVAKVLNDSMVNALPCDVPMRTDIAIGANWADLETKLARFE